MKAGKPSVTARFVALTRATLDRPTVETGDAAAEERLCRSLGGMPLLLRAGPEWQRRMERRTAFFDRATLGALEAGIDQVVILAAGYDGRALRFASPGVRWFEVDHPATQPDKRARLAVVGASVEHITFVAIDLVTGDLVQSLTAAGFDPGRAALFTAEGLLSYLPRHTTERLLTQVRVLAVPGSRLAVAVPLRERHTGAARVRRRVRRAVLSAIGEPHLHRFSPDDVDGLLADTGWVVMSDGRTPLRLQGPRGVIVVVSPAPPTT